MKTRNRYSKVSVLANRSLSGMDRAVSVMRGISSDSKSKRTKSVRARSAGSRGGNPEIGQLQSAAHKLFLSMRKEPDSAIFDKVIDSAQELTMDYIYAVLTYLDDGIKRADGEQVRDVSEVIKKLYRVMPSY